MKTHTIIDYANDVPIENISVIDLIPAKFVENSIDNGRLVQRNAF